MIFRPPVRNGFENTFPDVHIACDFSRKQRIMSCIFVHKTNIKFDRTLLQNSIFLCNHSRYTFWASATTHNGEHPVQTESATIPKRQVYDRKYGEKPKNQSITVLMHLYSLLVTIANEYLHRYVFCRYISQPMYALTDYYSRARLDLILSCVTNRTTYRNNLSIETDRENTGYYCQEASQSGWRLKTQSTGNRFPNLIWTSSFRITTQTLSEKKKNGSDLGKAYGFYCYFVSWCMRFFEEVTWFSTNRANPTNYVQSYHVAMSRDVKLVISQTNNLHILHGNPFNVRHSFSLTYVIDWNFERFTAWIDFIECCAIIFHRFHHPLNRQKTFNS